jgi:hypothetical protein
LQALKKLREQAQNGVRKRNNSVLNIPNGGGNLAIA